jgi:Mrp family chromosome partitioning ATPase
VELLESEGMALLLEKFTDEYDLVVIDSPPLPILADAIPLAKLVNGVIVVGRVNKTTRDEAQALHAQLESLDAPVLGVVANRTSRGKGYYGYYHAHPSASSAAET